MKGGFSLVDLFILASVAAVCALSLAFCVGCQSGDAKNAAMATELELCRKLTDNCRDYIACNNRVREEYGQEPFVAWCRDGGAP